MNPQVLTRPAAAMLHSLDLEAGAARDVLLRWESAEPERRVMRLVRGPKATTKAAFLDEVAAALQFPLYFGANWDALNDCLADLEWLRSASVVVLIVHAELLLHSAPAEELTTCCQVLQQAAKSQAHPTAGRPARALHVVFQTSDLPLLSRRTHAAGVKLLPLS